MSRTLLVGTVLLLTIACGTSSVSGGSGTSTGGLTGADAGTHPDAGSLDAGSTDAGSCNTGSACNTVTQLGQPVAVKDEVSDGPVPVGGTFVPGTYVLTNAVIFVGCPGNPTTTCTGAETPTGQSLPATTAVVTVNGGAVSMQIIQTVNGCEERENVNVTINGGAISAAQTCPGRGDGFAEFLPNCSRSCGSSWAYSTDPGSFSLFGEALEIFTEQ